MASIGIGGAKVETELDVDPNGVSAGEVIQGRFRVEGGKVEQEIDDIEIQLCCNYFVEKEVEDNTVIETRTHILTKQELEFDKKARARREQGNSLFHPYSCTYSANDRQAQGMDQHKARN